jgi:uncharacterized protein (UPF0332 family)
MKKKTEVYLKQVEVYCQQGEEELTRGDLRQAGEKYWGAATQVLKAYCEMKGWPHDGHALLFKDVGKISSDREDKTLIDGFSFASMLHINFYEGWLTKEEVERLSSQTMVFINKIKEILNKKVRK